MFCKDCKRCVVIARCNGDMPLHSTIEIGCEILKKRFQFALSNDIDIHSTLGMLIVELNGLKCEAESEMLLR